MRISGVSLAQFNQVVTDVSARRYEGNVIIDTTSARDVATVRTHSCSARLRTVRSAQDPSDRTNEFCAPGARRSWSGRRMPAACWHAYRDVLAELFRRYPHARVRTAMAVYNSQEGFQSRYPATAYKNIGSMMAPTTMPALCDCWDYGTDTPEPEELNAHV